MSFWRTLFGQNKQALQNGAAMEKRQEPDPEVEMAEMFDVVASVQTDVGCVRETNEDCAQFTRPQDPQVLTEKGMLVVVADGMGGCSGGEIASAIAVTIVPRSYYSSSSKPHEALREAFEKANREIHQAALDDASLAGMGTTGVALAIRGRQAYVAYVGDSRLYLIRAGRIYQMTQDHSLVFDMVRQGLLTPEDARNHEDRNVLVRSLGGRPEVEVTVWDEPMKVLEGDCFLLCSDGLHDLVEGEEMLEAVQGGGDDSAAIKLIEMAKERGGYDNITVALLRIRAANNTPAAGTKETREIQTAI